MSTSPPGDPGIEDQDPSVTHVGHAQGMLIGDHGTQNNRFTHITAERGAFVAGRDIVIAISPEFAVADLLADSVYARWNDEIKARRLNDHNLIAVEWQGDERLIGHEVNHGAVVGFASEVQGMVDNFLALNPQRLLLLGSAGAGKTAMAILMMLEILRRRSSNSAIPVMLSLSSWDMRTPLRSWIVHRIVSEYISEGEDVRKWYSNVERLVKQDLVIPVLDGLDELTAPARLAALKAVNSILPSQPLILTCRRDEYAQVVRCGHALENAVASEALPLAPGPVATYLQNRTGANNWEPVIAAVTKDPNSPIARTLSRPLMVSLLTAVYGGPGKDPSELLDLDRYPSDESIEQGLYSGLLDVYRSRMHFSVDGKSWNPERAVSWLSRLTRHLAKCQTYDIIIWELAQAVNRSQRMAIAALSALIGGFATIVFQPLVLGLAGGFATGLAIGYLTSFFRSDRSRSRGSNVSSTGDRGKMINLLIRGNGPLHRVIIGGLIGLVIGLITDFSMLDFSSSQRAYYGCGAALLIGASIGFPNWHPIIFNKTHSSISPRKQFRETRTKNLALAAAFVGGSALAISLTGWTYGGLVIGCVLAASAFLAILAVGESNIVCWWSFSIARVMLAATGVFPWHFMQFLEDSYNYEVLRRAGGVYQFRHAGLQDYLVEAPDTFLSI